MAHPYFAAQSIAEIGLRPPSKREWGDELSVSPDRGCKLWHQCLSCPLPTCISDLSPRQRWLFRDKIAELLREEKKKASD